ncbi:MAG: helix-hairpin-helix domain-containing protein [Bacteroidota bacterium]|nr:helix-hairpin-helix domain-containing protein [Bacteroidota bacterium]MDP4250085.1 helix-hairpin-helix domain-containing protein [Bacteroidota bacterium]
MNSPFRRWLTMLALFILSVVKLYSQDNPEESGESRQLEAIAEKHDAEPEDDSHEQDLENWRMHPLDLNRATEEELYGLQGLTALQIENFMQYRKLLGSLLSIYELQAVPGWDLQTIRGLLPYIKTGTEESLYSALRERWKGGDASLLLRAGQTLEKSAGYEEPAQPGASYYEGSPQKIFFRYAYNYKQLLQYGFMGEKDAGEPFFRGAQRYGFDFYSFHFFLHNTGIIRDLALGDFTVNLGQGLIQWQTFASAKGASVLGIKRQASCLKPYHSAGEFNFHRGAGITLQKGNWHSSLFFSRQKISSNADADTTGREDIFTSFENSGYHRTANEIADRNNNIQFSAGGNLNFSKTGLSLSANFIHFQFSRPFQKRDEPYNFYSFKGRRVSNASFDYGYTFRNMHVFGELAIDRDRHLALIQGTLVSLGAALDLSILYRNISPAYQSLYADAFTENGSPVNEKGLYTAISFRPGNALRLEMYYDLFVFPWLKYRVDAPSSGNDFSIQAFFQPDKNWYLRSQYKREKKGANQENAERGYHPVFSPEKERYQLETGYKISRKWQIKSRAEFIWIQKDWTENRTKQEGFLGFLDIFYNSRLINGNLRIQRFLIPGYDFRIYIYESDMLLNLSLPSYYDNGWRYYINLHKSFHLGKKRGSGVPDKLTAWVKWAQVIYEDKSVVGSGLDAINGNKKSEIKVQILFNW